MTSRSVRFGHRTCRAGACPRTIFPEACASGTEQVARAEREHPPGRPARHGVASRVYCHKNPREPHAKCPQRHICRAGACPRPGVGNPHTCGFPAWREEPPHRPGVGYPHTCGFPAWREEPPHRPGVGNPHTCGFPAWRGVPHATVWHHVFPATHKRASQRILVEKFSIAVIVSALPEIYRMRT